jgi:hypothetical protein
MARRDPERIEEAEINKVAVCVMADHATGKMKVGEIRAELPNYARLSSKDHTDSETRNREHLWEQQVRNLKSHDKNTGNIFCEGYVEWVRRGVRQLTESGRLRATHLRGSGFYIPA